MDIFVGRLMSSPVQTITPDTPVQEAAQIMVENEIGSVIVVDDDRQLAGILTSTDFVKIAAADANGSSTVGDYMSTDVITTTANDDIRDVADIMIQHGFHHVPVVDETEGVIGIITTTDLTAYLSHIETPSPA